MCSSIIKIAKLDYDKCTVNLKLTFLLICNTAPGTSNTVCRESYLAGINKIPDSALTACGQWGSIYTQELGRLDTQAKSPKAGSWVGPSRTDQSQWIQVCGKKHDMPGKAR